MTDKPDSRDEDEEATEGAEPTAEEVYGELEPFEPYTTREVASAFDVPKRLARRLLHAQNADGRVRKKEPKPDRAIWIREPPATTCPNCGREFEVKYLHAVLSAVRFCPRCGTRIE